MARKKYTDEDKRLSKIFSERLKSERKSLDLSQDDLSKISNISIDTIRSLESGRIVAPSLFMANKIIQALNGDLSNWMSDIEREFKND